MTSTTFDPTSTATQLAAAYTASRQQLLSTQTTAATATSTALTKLQSALTAFDTALTGLSGSATTSVLTNSATLGDTSIGTATATAAATAGTYAFFVKQLASANQVAYSNLSSVTASGSGTLGVSLAGGGSFTVTLAAADTDGNGTLTPVEMAAAINSASGNGSLVTASVITVGGQSQMVLTAGATGAGSAITLDTSGVGDAGLAASLGAGSQIVAAKDAIVYLGTEATGVELRQASNTFDSIAGVSITFKKAMATNDAPVTLKVATDTSATAAKLQTFVDAYNKLNDVLDGLTDTGDVANKKAAGAFANDSAVRALRSRLASTIRDNIGGVTLASYGVTADRYGVLSLDQGKLTARLATNPSGLDALLGNTGITTQSGVLGSIHTALDAWTGTSGQIKNRQSGVTKLQSSLTTRQSTLDTQYNNAYARYLAQFTQLQTLQAQMTQTTNLFDALFSNNSNN